MESSPKASSKPRGPRHSWLLVLVLAFLGACAAPPAHDTGPGYQTATPTTAEGEDPEVAEIARQVEEEMGLVEDPRLVAYVQEVGLRVASHTERKDVDYRFHVLDMPEPNAFALPDGRVYVSRGMLVLINNEDELAGVLAHEIAHVERNHSQRRKNIAIATAPIRLGAGLVGLATSVVSPEAGAAVAGFGNTASLALLAPYGRDQEREADEVGQALAAKAGYSPGSLSDVLTAMVRVEALAPEQETEQTWFSTHPATSERVGSTREHAKTLTPAGRHPAVKDRAQMLRLLSGLIIGPDPSHGLFDGRWFVHPDLRFAIEFPKGWETINTRSFVGAKAPDVDAFVVLQAVARGSDPMRGAEIVSKNLETDLVSKSKPLNINGLPAAVTRGKIGKDASHILDFTWIAYGGLVYQVMAVSPADGYENTGMRYAETATSFRPLTSAEISRIKVVRLRPVAARQGETLAELAERSDNVWIVEWVAAANGRRAGDELDAGELIKVATPERYVPET